MLPKLLEVLNNKLVVLASGSPARAALLKRLGLNVRLVPSKFEENLRIEDFNDFGEFVEATAYGKVTEVEERLIQEGTPPFLVIGADTMVTFDGIMFGKPKSTEDAFNTLKKLSSGKPHEVVTGVVLKMGEKVVKFSDTTKVYMGPLSDAQIREYISTGEPMNKAGSYGIQDSGGVFVQKVDGDFFTVVGIPLYKLNQELTKLVLE